MLRPGSRTAVSGAAAAAGSRRACAAAEHAPHRERRGEHRGAGQRVVGLVHGLCRGAAVTVGGVGDSVCGLCGMATRVAAGRSVAGAVAVLAGGGAGGGGRGGGGGGEWGGG